MEVTFAEDSRVGRYSSGSAGEEKHGFLSEFENKHRSTMFYFLYLSRSDWKRPNMSIIDLK